MTTQLSVLAVDDEPPALDELVYSLRQCPAVGTIYAAHDAAEALRCLEHDDVDVVFLDVVMPGLDGLELAGVLNRFARAPAVVFVTAHEKYAVAAFGVQAVDYVLKPFDVHRLSAALARVTGRTSTANRDSGEQFATLAADLPGRTVLIDRSEVEWVEAAGDYVRVHTHDGHSYLVRVPLAVLAERWEPHGFARIHRSHLVALRAVREIATRDGQTSVLVGGHHLPVSRRHLRDFRERLFHGRAPREDAP
ncbi:MAG: response regulator transcription factor [Acidothermus cellulolyticus]|nr:response regulator transcription factor [Acidothermus cellulolyticus]MCL6549469.1 LytTR family DNA-binding domain-containing protein [Acidothermus cellulolyticus]